MRGRFAFIIMAMALLCAMVGIATAATVTPDITYQGVLTDGSGNPLTGTYGITFRLYDVDYEGIPLATSVQHVQVINGQFTTPVTFDLTFFDGRALWIGIAVESDSEMSPRQEIRPVPYALSLRPGAVLRDATSGWLLLAENEGTGAALVGLSWDGEGVFGRGKYGGTFRTNAAGTDIDPRIGVNVSTAYNYNPGIIVSTSGQFSGGLRTSTAGYGSNAIYASTGGETSYGMVATTSGRYSDAIRASTSADDSTGAYIRTYGSRSPGISATTSNSQSDGIFISTSGATSDGIEASTAGGGSHGVRVTTYGSGSHGVYSSTSGASSNGIVALTTNTNSNGVYARTDGDTSFAVNTLTTGPNSVAVHGQTQGSNSKAVVGESAQDVGVYGKGKVGGYFTTNQAGTYTNFLPGVVISTSNQYNPGANISTTGSVSQGISVKTTGAQSTGVWSETTNTGSTALYGRASGTDSPGVIGESAQYAGIYGTGKEGGYFTTKGAGTHETSLAGVDIFTQYGYNPGVKIKTTGPYNSDGVAVTTEGMYSDGLHAYTSGYDSDGVDAWTYGAESQGVTVETEGDNIEGVYVHTSGLHSNGVDAETWGDSAEGIDAYSDKANGIFTATGRWDDKWGLYTPDYIYAKGTQYPSVDVAEYFPVEGSPESGTVMVVGPEGVLQSSTTAYDTRVVGIVSTDPAVSLGVKDTGNPGEVPIAVAGRVPCKVDASNGPIQPGDLLTTSDRPGYAMKAEPTMINGRGFYPDGTILGKAMGTLESGTGVIEVLVTLQ